MTNEELLELLKAHMEKAPAEAAPGEALSPKTPGALPSPRFLELLKAAAAGDADAQFRLSNCFAQGLGFRQDWAEAAFWTRRAADQDHPGALNNLGYFLEEGLGLPQDLEESRRCYEKAAEKESSAALNNLAAQNIRLEREMEEAPALLRQAADLGCVEAHTNLARCLYKGLGCNKDRAASYEELHLAADAGSELARMCVGLFRKDENQPNQIEEDQLPYLREAADLGDPCACINRGYWLCRKFLDLEGLEQEAAQQQAVSLFWKAALCEEKDPLTHQVYRVALGQGEELLWLRQLPWFPNAVRESRKTALENLSAMYSEKCPQLQNEPLGRLLSGWASREGTWKVMPVSNTISLNLDRLSPAQKVRLGEWLVQADRWEEAVHCFQSAGRDPQAKADLLYCQNAGHKDSFPVYCGINRAVDRCENLVLRDLQHRDEEDAPCFSSSVKQAAQLGSVAAQLLHGWDLWRDGKPEEARCWLAQAAAWNGPTRDRNAFGQQLPCTAGDHQEELVHVAPWFRDMALEAAQLARSCLSDLDRGLEAPGEDTEAHLHSFVLRWGGPRQDENNDWEDEELQEDDDFL